MSYNASASAMNVDLTRQHLSYGASPERVPHALVHSSLRLLYTHVVIVVSKETCRNPTTLPIIGRKLRLAVVERLDT